MRDNRDLTRRSALAGLGALAATMPMTGSVAAPIRASFPPGFLWAAATAAHQVEGNNTNSDWWLLETIPNRLIKEPSADACDHYHLFESDIALLASLGLNAYRFSIEWARVEPIQGLFSHAELNHYRNVLLACRKHGLKTIVTLHHFTLPRWLAEAGGFENPATTDAFARYAGAVLRHCGDLINYICTINEVNLSFSAFMPRDHVDALNAEAARATGSPKFASFLFDDFTKSKAIVKECHSAARAAIKAIDPKMPVGMTISMNDIQDAPGAPGFGVKRRSDQYDVWLTLARQDDFVGVQNYTRERVGPNGSIDPPPGSIRSQLGQEYYPQSLANSVRYAASVAKVPVIVTENGIGIEDDSIRERYISEALAGLRQCMADGVDVRGYVHWSAMDNFEWTFGYGPKFGLIAVDRQTQTRQLKKSAYRLGNLARVGHV